MDTKSESIIHLAGQPYDIKGPYKIRHMFQMRGPLLEAMGEIAAAKGDVDKVDHYLHSMNSGDFERLMMQPLFHALKSTATPALDYEQFLDMDILPDEIAAAWSVVYRQTFGLPRPVSKTADTAEA